MRDSRTVEVLNAVIYTVLLIGLRRISETCILNDSKGKGKKSSGLLRKTKKEIFAAIRWCTKCLGIICYSKYCWPDDDFELRIKKRNENAIRIASLLGKRVLF